MLWFERRPAARQPERLVVIWCGLTFELTPRAEAGTVSRDGDDGSAGAGPAYSACRSESGGERVVRSHCARAEVADTSNS